MATLTRILGYLNDASGNPVKQGKLSLTLQQDMVSIDGTKVAPFTVSADLSPLPEPSGVTVVPQGTIGSTTYGYRIVAVDGAGGVSLPSATVTTATGNASLSVSNFNRVTWAAIPEAVSYKVYGRTSGGELFIANVSSGTTYDDTGAASPSGSLPTVNTSGGYFQKDVYATVGATPAGLSYYVEFDSDPDDLTKPASQKDGYWYNYWAVPDQASVAIGNFVSALRGQTSANYMPIGGVLTNVGDELMLGTVAADTTKTLTANVSGVNKPKFRYNFSSSKWEVSNNGTTFEDLATAGNQPTHNMLSTTHPDTTQGTVARGDVITGQGATPKWTRLAKGTAGQVLTSDGTDVSWAAVPTQTSALLSATHTDTTAAAVARGDLVVGQGVSTKWERLALGATNQVLVSDGTDAVWSSNVAFKTLANEFTQNQLISKSLPRWGALHAGSTMARFAQYTTNAIHLSHNLLWDGSSWNLDDTGSVGGVLLGDPTNGFEFHTATAGSNPRTLTKQVRLSRTGQIFERARTTALGEWIAVSYNSGDFTAATGTWTVDNPSDYITFRYTLIGKTMTVSFDFRTTTVSNVTSALRVAIPGGFTAAAEMRNVMNYVDNGGSSSAGTVLVVGGATTISFAKFTGDWAASTNLTTIIGQITFEVQ
jgi:hypothetical protein